MFKFIEKKIQQEVNGKIEGDLAAKDEQISIKAEQIRQLNIEAASYRQQIGILEKELATVRKKVREQSEADGVLEALKLVKLVVVDGVTAKDQVYKHMYSSMAQHMAMRDNGNHMDPLGNLYSAIIG